MSEIEEKFGKWEMGTYYRHRRSWAARERRNWEGRTDRSEERHRRRRRWRRTGHPSGRVSRSEWACRRTPPTATKQKKETVRTPSRTTPCSAAEPPILRRRSLSRRPWRSTPIRRRPNALTFTRLNWIGSSYSVKIFFFFFFWLPGKFEELFLAQKNWPTRSGVSFKEGKKIYFKFFFNFYCLFYF